MRGLYAIVDLGVLSARGIDPLKFARAVLRAHPAALQLRAKDAPARDILALLRGMGPMCRNAGALFVANDRVDLAVMAGCDAVHIGQEDLAIDRARRIAPGLRIGLSTHTPAQLARALEARPDYVAYGPVFTTTSKKDPESVVGLDGLKAAGAAARAARIPLVAIGGITIERAGDVAAHADAAAVIGGLLPEGPLAPDLADVTERARALHAILGGTAGVEARI